MSTLDAIDWPAFSTPTATVSDPNNFDANVWLPPDFSRGFGDTDYSAGPTRCVVDWLNNNNIRPTLSQEDEQAVERNGDYGATVPDPWAGIVYAYDKLPDPRAVETIILGHIPLASVIVTNWVWRFYNRKADQNDGDLFSMALLLLTEIVPSMKVTGEKYKWDDWESPAHMASYLGTSIWNQLSEDFRKRQKEHKGILEYLELKPRPSKKIPSHFFSEGYHCIHTAVPQNKSEKMEDAEDAAESEETQTRKRAIDTSVPNWMPYDYMTPDKIMESQERPKWQKATFGEMLDAVCVDIYDRLLLTMKRKGTLSEAEMGELYGLSRDNVNRRIARLHSALQEELGYDPDMCSKHQSQTGKRCTRQPDERQLAKEVLASWRCPIEPDSTGVVPAPHFPMVLASEHTVCAQCV